MHRYFTRSQGMPATDEPAQTCRHGPEIANQRSGCCAGMPARDAPAQQYHLGPGMANRRSSCAGAGMPARDAPAQQYLYGPGMANRRSSCAGAENVAPSTSGHSCNMSNDMPECDAPRSRRMQDDINEALADADADCCVENHRCRRPPRYPGNCFTKTLRDSCKLCCIFLFTFSFAYGIFLLCYHLPLLERKNANTEIQLQDLRERVVNLTDQVTSSVEDYKSEIARKMRPDFALESAGGRIVTTRDTRTYSLSQPSYLLGFLPMCQDYQLPSTIINPSVYPGECWAFEGAQASAVIQLVGKIRVTGVSIEHIPPVLAPTGDINTAPKEFSLYGLTEPDELNGHHFGNFLYEKNGTALQYFDTIHQTTRAYNYVELKIHSNHGNRDYTCLYRVRIHGQMENPSL